MNDLLVPVSGVVRARYDDAPDAGVQGMPIHALGHVDVRSLVDVALAGARDTEIRRTVVPEVNHRVDAVEHAVQIIVRILEEVDDVHLSDRFAARVGGANIYGSELVALAEDWQELRGDIPAGASQQHSPPMTRWRR